MAKAKKKRKTGKRRANAKRRSSSKRRRNAIYASNPGNPRRSHKRRSSKRRRNAIYASNPGNPRRRRRRNPGMLEHPAVMAAIAAVAGVASAVVVSVAAPLITTNKTAQLAIAGAGVAAGALLATKHPAIGGAVAAGALGAVATPFLQEKALELVAKDTKPSGTTVAALRRARDMGAVKQLAGFNPFREAPFNARTPWGSATG